MVTYYDPDINYRIGSGKTTILLQTIWFWSCISIVISMKPRLLFFLANVVILLFWVALFIDFDMVSIMGLLFEWHPSFTAIINASLIAISCLALAQLYRHYACRYLKIEKFEIIYWSILYSAILMFLTIFFQLYHITSSVDPYAPALTVMLIATGMINNIASGIIFVTFLVLLIRKPKMTIQKQKKKSRK